LKIAIVHDWLVNYGGAERVLEQLLDCYPNADLYCLFDFLPAKNRIFLNKTKIHTSFLQNIKSIDKFYRFFFPLFPLAIEQFDLNSYDLIISSSHSVAKGVLVSPEQLHICICYSPVRYAWDMQFKYLSDSNLLIGIKSWIVRWFLHKFRLWDSRTSNSVDEFIAISKFISRRINKIYRRNSTVIYPPVNTNYFRPEFIKSDYYLTVSRLVGYKKISLIIEAFNHLPNKKLIVIGAGPEFKKCKSLANNNIIMLGEVSDFELLKYLQSSKAFIFAAEDDFGIAPLEAQACGTPIIAYGKGGALETIIGHNRSEPTGVFFEEQVIDSLIKSILFFEVNQSLFTADNCRNNALFFSNDRFKSELINFIDSKYNTFKNKNHN